MAMYQYRGLARTGQEIKATISAENVNSAKTKLKSQGVLLLEIKEQESKSSKKSTGISFGSPVKIEELALMTRQLATLIGAKIQIVEAFNALIDQVDDEQLKIVLSEVRQKVNEGSSLANAMNDYPKIFDNIYVNMVEAGEASGTLDIVLIRLADFKESQVRLKGKIKGAMTYPTIMIVVGFSMMIIIFTLVIPKITKIFITMKKELPLQTQICIWFSDFLRDYYLLYVPGSIMLFFMFHHYIRTTAGKRRWHKFLLRAPIVGKLSMKINTARFCDTLATLLNSGVPILTSLKIVKNLIDNVHMQETVESARASIQEGASLALPLKKSGHFPSMVTHMIALGEKSGELEPMLQIVAKNYNNQVENELQGITSILEPIMMVVMGLLVAFIVFSIIGPMMELTSVSK